MLTEIGSDCLSPGFGVLCRIQMYACAGATVFIIILTDKDRVDGTQVTR
ncbi:MAG: hypothetical protein GWN00_27400 [Aliifodinibius sp.]|nr:hypothetical protein [Fodinibius sp.]NIW44776.1 hypothetical protein [Gammaproteobacteria bacterium]NIW97407.1 hypothetical protein [Phycisphaerae bacterium]NIY28393.1 hypothetical protein [Fodinibius sp.]